MEIKYKFDNKKNKLTAMMILLPFLVSFLFLLAPVWHNKNAVILDTVCMGIWVFVFLCIFFSGINLYSDRIIAKAFIFKKTIILDDIGTIGIVGDEQNGGGQKECSDGTLVFYSKEGRLIYYLPLRVIGGDVKDFVNKIVEIKTSIKI